MAARFLYGIDVTSDTTLQITLSACHGDPNEMKITLFCPTEVTPVWSRHALMSIRRRRTAGRTLNPGRQIGMAHRRQTNLIFLFFSLLDDNARLFGIG